MTNTVLVSLDGDTSALVNSLFRTYPRRDFLKMRTADVDVHTQESAFRSATFAGVTRKPRAFIVDHEILATGADYEKARMAIRALYNPKPGVSRNAPRLLVFTENGVNKRAWAHPVKLLPHESGVRRGVAQGEWLLLSTIYYADSASSVAAAAKTATPATVAVSNAGTEPSEAAVYTFKPTAAKTAANGQRYRLYVTVVNNAPRALPRHPIALLTGWDHAAEVTATRSHSSGKDVEVYSAHRRVMRWFGAGTAAANQATATVWITDDLEAEREWADNGGATIGTGDTTFYTSTPLTHMPALPFWAALEDEVVQVTAYDAAAGTVTIGRGKRGSTAATHASGTPMKLAVAYDVVYGGTSLATPRYIDDAYKPIPAAHQSSLNTAWTYAVYQETESTNDTQSRKPRPGSWRTARRPFPDWTGREDMYGKWIPRTASLSTDATPATKMGIVYRDNGASPGHPLVDRWEIYFGVAIDSFAFTQDTTSLEQLVPNEGRLFVYAYGRDGSEELVATYENSGSSPTLTFDPPVIGLAFAIRPHDPKDIQDNPTGTSVGAHKPTDNDGFTIAANGVATFNSGERLKTIASSRQDCYQIGRPDAPATWENVDGEALSIYGVVMALDQTLTIDVLARTATLDDGTSVVHALSGEYPSIPADPAAPPFASDLTYSEAGLTGGASITLGIPAYRSAW